MGEKHKGRRRHSEAEPWRMPEPTPAPTAGPLPPPAEIIRHSYRDKVRDTDAVLLEIEGQTYPVIDIGSRGVGICLPEPDLFPPGRTVDLKILLQGEVLRLRGRVKHITPDDETDDYRCGIELIDLQSEDEERLQRFLLQQRLTLFARDGSSPTGEPG